MLNCVAKCAPPTFSDIEQNMELKGNVSHHPQHTILNENLTTELFEHLYSNDPANLTIDIIFWIVFNSILCVCILGGNILTFVAVRTCRRLRAIISNLFISSLAISDFIVGLTVPFHMAFYVGFDLGQYRELCLMRFVLIIFACCLSIFMLISIAVDRYIAILYPLQYRRFMTRRIVYFLIIVAWISGAGVASIPMFWNHFDTASQCEFDEILPIGYMAGIITPGFILIWTVMSVVYWRIMREASKQAQQLRHSIPSQKSTATRSDSKSIQIVVIIMGCFSICWLPYFIVTCGQMLNLFTITSALYKGTLTLAMANSSVNPIIYAWKNTNFCRAFLKLLRCKSPNGCPRDLVISQFSIRFQNPPTKFALEQKVEIKSAALEKGYLSAEQSPEFQRSKLTVDVLPVNQSPNHAPALSDDDSSSVSGFTTCIACKSVLCKSTQRRKYSVIQRAIEDELGKYQTTSKGSDSLQLDAQSAIVPNDDRNKATTDYFKDSEGLCIECEGE